MTVYDNCNAFVKFIWPNNSFKRYIYCLTKVYMPVPTDHSLSLPVPVPESVGSAYRSHVLGKSKAAKNIFVIITRIYEG